MIATINDLPFIIDCIKLPTLKMYIYCYVFISDGTQNLKSGKLDFWANIALTLDAFKFSLFNC